jgi:hypothetical protein
MICVAAIIVFTVCCLFKLKDNCSPGLGSNSDLAMDYSKMITNCLRVLGFCYRLGGGCLRGRMTCD